MMSIRRHNTSWKHSLLFDDRAQRSAMCWCSSELNTTQNGPGECDKMKDLRRIVMIDLYHFELLACEKELSQANGSKLASEIPFDQ